MGIKKVSNLAFRAPDAIALEV